MPLSTFELVLLVVTLAVVVWVVRERTRRPVAEELAEAFGEPVTRYPGPRAMSWAYGVLFEAGVDADGDGAYAVKVLRRANRKLSQAAAKALVDRMLAD